MFTFLLVLEWALYSNHGNGLAAGRIHSSLTPQYNTISATGKNPTGKPGIARETMSNCLTPKVITDYKSFSANLLVS
jgi:hypothetical protein